MNMALMRPPRRSVTETRTRARSKAFRQRPSWQKAQEQATAGRKYKPLYEPGYRGAPTEEKLVGQGRQVTGGGFGGGTIGPGGGYDDFAGGGGGAFGTAMTGQRVLPDYFDPTTKKFYKGDELAKFLEQWNAYKAGKASGLTGDVVNVLGAAGVIPEQAYDTQTRQYVPKYAEGGGRGAFGGDGAYGGSFGGQGGGGLVYDPKTGQYVPQGGQGGEMSPVDFKLYSEVFRQREEAKAAHEKDITAQKQALLDARDLGIIDDNELALMTTESDEEQNRIFAEAEKLRGEQLRGRWGPTGQSIEAITGLRGQKAGAIAGARRDLRFKQLASRISASEKYAAGMSGITQQHDVMYPTIPQGAGQAGTYTSMTGLNPYDAQSPAYSPTDEYQRSRGWMAQLPTSFVGLRG